jgi:hypothetical protein
MKARKLQPEYHLQANVCRYLSVRYPKVLFLSDTVASVALTPAQAYRNKVIQKSSFKTPDLIILQPNGKFHALLIELKVKSPYKLNGEIRADEHLQGQQKSIDDLNALGYYACFAWSLEMAMKIIDDYMNNRL